MARGLVNRSANRMGRQFDHVRLFLADRFDHQTHIWYSAYSLAPPPSAPRSSPKSRRKSLHRWRLRGLPNRLLINGKSEVWKQGERIILSKGLRKCNSQAARYRVNDRGHGTQSSPEVLLR